MKRLLSFAAALAFSLVMFAAPAYAESDGQLAGGADIYQVRNVTQNTQYGSTASVACNETVKYSVKLSNTEFGLLSNVTVKANLANGSMTASATNAANATVTTSGTVNVSVSGGTLAYVPGSTQLFTVDGQLITNLGDGVTGAGINAGNLNGSTREFLQFQAKVSCTTKECKPGIPVGDVRCKEVPTTLVDTGAGNVLGLFAVITVAGALARSLVLARRS